MIVEGELQNKLDFETDDEQPHKTGNNTISNFFPNKKI